MKGETAFLFLTYTPSCTQKHCACAVREHRSEPFSHYEAFRSFKCKSCPIPVVDPCIRLVKRDSLLDHNLEGSFGLHQMRKKTCQGRGDGISSNTTFTNMPKESIAVHSNCSLQQVLGLHCLCFGRACKVTSL